MSNAKNQYEKKAKQKSLLGIESSAVVMQETKGNVKQTLIQTGMSLLLGVGAGLVSGVVIGKTSFYLGIAAMGASYYYGSQNGVLFGAGMLAANGYQKATGTLTGTEEPMEGLEGIKERLMNFRDSFSEKLFLDKLLKKKPEAKPTNGLGEVQYFTYPANAEALPASEVGEIGEVDMSALDQIEKQLIQSAEAQSNRQPQKAVSGTEDEAISGLFGDERIF